MKNLLLIIIALTILEMSQAQHKDQVTFEADIANRTNDTPFGARLHRAPTYILKTILSVCNAIQESNEYYSCPNYFLFAHCATCLSTSS